MLTKSLSGVVFRSYETRLCLVARKLFSSSCIAGLYIIIIIDILINLQTVSLDNSVVKLLPLMSEA